MKKIINFFNNYFKKPLLGRWNIKNCSHNSTNINAFYQNRDHCGDILCKQPLKPEHFKNK